MKPGKTPAGAEAKVYNDVDDDDDDDDDDDAADCCVVFIRVRNNAKHSAVLTRPALTRAMSSSGCFIWY